MSILFKPEDVEISIHTTPEWDDPAGHFCDDEAVAYVRKLAEETEWGWCTVEVRVTWHGFTGSAYLGACTYANEAEFCEVDRADMIEEALDDLERYVRAAIVAAAEIQTFAASRGITL